MEWRVYAESEPVLDESLWDEKVDVMLAALEDTEGAHGPIGYGTTGKLGAVFVVDRPSLKEAFEFAHNVFQLALKEAGTNVVVTRLEVEPADAEEVDLVGASDIAQMLGVSRQRVYQLLARGDFPTATGKLARGAVWDRRRVEAWMATARQHPAATVAEARASSTS